MTAAEIVRRLDLRPHPEGGWYRETFRDAAGADGRARSTAIYYLLDAGQRSHWHRIDAVEDWHVYAGAPLTLRITQSGAAIETVTLGSDLAKGEQPQAVVPAGFWQAAESLGAFTLVGCTVAPGFAFDGFELAPPGFSPT